MEVEKDERTGLLAGPPEAHGPGNPPPTAKALHVSLVLILVHSVWSINAIYVKTALAELPVLVWCSMRLIFATPAFFLLAYFREREALFSPRPLLEWLWLIGLGLLSMVVNQLLFVAALSLTTATNIGIISPAIAVFSTAISALLCLEKLSLWQVIGVSMTVVGALLILQVENFDLISSDDVLLGNVLALLSTLAFSLFIVFQKPLTGRVPPAVLNAFAFAVGLVVLVPITFIGWWDNAIEAMGKASLSAHFSTVFSALAAGVLAYVLNTWAIKNSSASNASMYYCLQALLIAILAWLLLDEQLTVRVVVGGVLIMAGLLVVTWALDQRRRKALAKDKEMVIELRGAKYAEA